MNESNSPLRHIQPWAGIALKVSAGAIGLWLAARWLRERRDYDFRRKIVLITGGSRGLGLVLARELALEGARLVICARDGEELRRAFDDLVPRAEAVLAVRCDLRDQNQVDDMVKIVQKRWGPIDVLINNAG